jgi:hypothetical protein
MRATQRSPGRTLRVLGPFALSLAALAAAPATVSAGLVLNLNTEFSGGSNPSGTAPWLRAEFTDAGTDAVSLTLTSLLQDADEFVGIWAFNFNPSATAAQLAALSIVQGTGPAAAITKGINFFQADGDGQYDIKFDFDTSASGDRFEQGDVATFTITGSGITEASFNFLSNPAGGKGPFITAAHVQGIGPSAGQSGWITGTGTNLTAAPEPGTMGLALTAVAILAVPAFRRFRRRQDPASA